MKAVAFFCDSVMLPGLHVSLATLLQSLRPGGEDELDVHLFLDDVRGAEKDLLRRTADIRSLGRRLMLHDYSPSAPAGGNTLHGNTTTYGRLYLADLLPNYDQCVYLDSDLLVNRCVLELFREFDGKSAVLADGAGQRRYSNDTELFAAAGVDLQGPYFNAGVLGMDLRLWRERGISRACEEAARRHAGLIRNADQALLNTVLHDDFKSVGVDWNLPLYPTTAPVGEPRRCIYHFVGSPKPWDVLGSRVVRNHPLWLAAYRTTAIGDRSYLRYASVRRSLRTWKSLARALLGS